MNRLYWCVICLCAAITSAELLGPEGHKDKEKTDEDESSVDALKKPSKEKKSVDEFLEVLKDTANKFKNDADAIDEHFAQYAETEQKIKEFIEDPSKFSENQLEYAMELLRKHHSWIESEPNWRKDSMITEDGSELDKTIQKLSESEKAFKEIDEKADVEEKEPELTPELKEAKEIYDAAIAKLDRRTADLRGAILQVKQAAERGYGPAKIKLAWSYIFGEGVELDVDKARNIFEEMASEGDAEAHAGLGFLHATGVGARVSQARALLHYALGAQAGSDFAQMALAYRHWAGAAVPASCPKAMQLYMQVAAKVASKVTLSGGPAVQRTRLLDEAEGGGGALDSDLIEYYQLLADKGDVQAQVGLGQLHLQGGRGVTLDVAKAQHYFLQAAKAGNAAANAFLGKIYLEGGDGITPNNDTALHYFKKAAEMNNPVGQSGLGIMYLQGRGVPKDTTAAFKYFTMAANQGWVEGQLHLGFMYFGGIGVRRDFKQAKKYFSLASQSGHVLALYHLALMHAQGLGVLRSCTMAVELLKNVCERGPWSARLMWAHAGWRARDSDSAFLQYLALAERGLEVAQSNAAFLLDLGEVRLFPERERWVRARPLWRRAAAQGCAGARVKLGDYHYYGLGTAPDLEAAAHHYRIASEQLHNAQATFNLGYMHEHGLGLARDPHLAKRCYDLAADTSPDARLPAALALARLHAAAALQRLAHTVMESPLSVLFVSEEAGLLANWDAVLIAALAAALATVVVLRRAPRPN